MVERTKAQGFEEFEGVIEKVEVEKSNIKGQEETEQYHIIMRPTNLTVGGSTGMMHEWVRIPPKATPVSVPEGSILDRYLLEIEDLMPDATKKSGHAEVFSLLMGKKFLFKQKVLGKSFDGHDAKKYWIPKQLLKK